MTSILTGDIIKSRNHVHPEIWINILKRTLKFLTKDENGWELYRGDSFQIEIKNPQLSFMAAVYIKACIKTIKDLDVRIAIGVGEKSYEGENITESNGSAFVYSGETLESLKKEKQNLRIKSAHSTIDTELNLYFKFALISMDNWTVNSAEIVKLSLEHPNKLQSELGTLMSKSQHAVSKSQKRSQLDSILELNRMYKHKISQMS